MTPRTSTLTSILLISLLGLGCTAERTNRDPVGEPFPMVTGKALSGSSVTLPTDFRGAPSLVLAGYVQSTQFDIDRWMLGLMQLEAEIVTIEVPAIEGWFPSTFLRPTIDGGMRDGIPQEDWQSVVTLYGEEAERLQVFTGTERPGNARVLLLGASGDVLWFWDQGYSPKRLREMLGIAAPDGRPGTTGYDDDLD